MASPTMIGGVGKHHVPQNPAPAGTMAHSAWVRILGSFLLVTSSAHGVRATDADAPPRLVPIFEFAEPAQDADHTFRLSPDGSKLAWVGSRDGRPVLRFRTIEGDGGGLFDLGAPIDGYAWAGDSRHILLAKDADGRENVRFVALDTRHPESPARDLIPFVGGRNIYTPIPDDARGILVYNNARDESAFDLYRIDPTPNGNPPLLLATNPGDVARWGVDRDGRLVWRQRTISPSERAVEVSVEERWVPGFGLGPDDALEVLGPAAEGSMVWALSNRFRDRASLVKLDLRTGEEQVYHQEDAVDVEGALLDPATGEPVAAWAWPDHQKLSIFDAALRRALEPLLKASPARVEFLSAARSKRRLVVSIQTAAAGTETFLLDHEGGSVALLNRSIWARHLDTLSPTRPIRFAARDGLTIHGYVTLPKGYPAARLPTVVSVHGGPWARDFLNMGLDDQFLANRGYAVLKINYRGSTGYGRAFQRAGNKEFGAKINDDIIDGVRWLVDQGIADPRRVAIMGESFGGYVALSALIEYPEIFAAGVSVSGPTHLPSLLEDFPKAWTNEMWLWTRFAGDLADREDLRRMEDRSPLNHASRTSRPVLFVYGANDIRTPRDQADRMIAALRRHGKEFKFLILSNEGHSFRRPSSRAAYFRAVEDFLAEHLGGRKSAAN